MLFEWDADKAARNLEKHGVAFAFAALIFGAEAGVLEAPDRRRGYGEERIRAVGEVEGIVLFVVYTWRGGARRLISACRASHAERERYRALHPARPAADRGGPGSPGGADG